MPMRIRYKDFKKYIRKCRVRTVTQYYSNFKIPMFLFLFSDMHCATLCLFIPTLLTYIVSIFSQLVAVFKSVHDKILLTSTCNLFCFYSTLYIHHM